MADLVGQQFGDYRLIRQLGQGSFGTVYQAEQIYIRTQVAIKVLHGTITDAEQAKLRNEASNQAALEHAHIVPVLGYSEQPVPYLVMKFAPNGTLKDRYPLGLRSPLATILPHVHQIAEGLQHAHDLHTLHLDLKPANILLGKQQEALISDFGIVVILAEHRTHQTVGTFAGTPAYAAPEQIQNKPGKASDQYALATMVYQWMAGKLPFEGDLIAVIGQKLHQEAPPLRAFLPDLPPAVEQVVMTALSKDPQLRFASVQAFVTAFEQANRIAPPLVRPSTPVFPATWQNAPTQVTPQQSAPPPPLQRTPASPAQILPAQVAVAQAQSTIPDASPPTLSGAISGQMAPLAALPTPSKAKHRWARWLLMGLLVLVLMSGSLVGLGYAGKGPFASLGKPAIGTIKEFVLPELDSGPLGITAGPDGNLWFTEENGNKIGRITPSGHITEFAVPTAHNSLEDITTGPDGNLWFTEHGHIGRITPGGQITEFAILTDNSDLAGITAGPDGNLWFTEMGTSDNGGIGSGRKIERITPGGQIREFVLPIDYSSPVGITAGPDGNLWFTEGGDHKIGRITPAGSITEFPVPSNYDDSGLSGITAGPDGNLWFTEPVDSQIGRITIRGQIIEFTLPIADSDPGGIAAGPDGNLWFTDYSTDSRGNPQASQIGRITLSGQIIEFALSTNSHPTGITRGPDGNLWFTEEYGNKIGWISPGA